MSPQLRTLSCFSSAILCALFSTLPAAAQDRVVITQDDLKDTTPDPTLNTSNTVDSVSNVVTSVTSHIGIQDPTLAWGLVFGLVACAAVLGLVVRARRNHVPSEWREGSIHIQDLNVQQGAKLEYLKQLREKLQATSQTRKLDAIKLLNTVLSAGLSLQASDIHMMPGEIGTQVSLRIQGTLYELGTIPPQIHAAISSRVKVLSDLAIYKKNIPQDGSFQVMGSSHTIRVSLLPTNHGEKIVMRLTHESADVYDLESLGMGFEMLRQYREVLEQRQGVIILTGPTGSGKTTTMYSSLNHVRNVRGSSTNFATLEDPIEYDLPGVSQTQIDTATGLTFAQGLRAVLRQDPDVIMLGEIRDEETASNAMRAAMTGHLIFTTVHADNASGVFGRLVQMGIEPYHLTSAVGAVISQRLVPKLCPHCRVATPISSIHRERLESMGLGEVATHTFYTSKGCEACFHKGIQGREALFELLVMNDALRDLITNRKSSHDIERQATVDGMHTLLLDGLRKAKRGDVELAEVLRVVSS